MKNIKLATKISVIVIAILSVCFVVLWKTTDNRVSSLMKEQVLQEMNDALSTRSEIVEQYVQSAESYLIGLGQSLEFKEALRNPDNADVIAGAQSYTESYASVNPNMENVYLADYDSLVLTSYVKGPIGKNLREGDALEALRSEVFDSNEIWNTGIMASPSTGLQVISMYYPIFENDRPSGYVGGAIYVEDLKNTLNALQESEENTTDYMLLDAATGTYIFCQDEEKIGMPIEEESVLTVIEKAKEGTGPDNFYEYKENGINMLSVYRYMPVRNWVLVITTDSGEAFSSISQMSGMLIILYTIVLLVISAVVFGAARLIAKDITKESHIVRELGNLDLTLRHKLDAYASRKDEVGMIAESTLYLTETVEEAVKLLKEKNEELSNASRHLISRAEDTMGFVGKVEKAINAIADSAAKQADDTKRAAKSVLYIGETIGSTMEETEALSKYTGNIQKNSEGMRSTVKALSQVSGNTEKAIEEISAQTLSTNESAMKIKDAAQLITSIAEETNLLSLNASIEAARAGDQGRGFAVVASQIQKLAEQSNDSAKFIDQIINTLIADSGKAVASMEEMKKIMLEQSHQLFNTEEQFKEMYQDIEVTKQSVSAIYDTVKKMDEERMMVVEVVQSLSSIAQANADSTKETLASTELVNDMVKDISAVSTQLISVSDAIEKSVGDFTV